MEIMDLIVYYVDEEERKKEVIGMNSYYYYKIRKAAFGYDSQNSIEKIRDDEELFKMKLEISGAIYKKRHLKIKKAMEKTNELFIEYIVAIGQKRKKYSFKGGSLKSYEEKTSTQKGERGFVLNFSFGKGREEVLSVVRNQ